MIRSSILHSLFSLILLSSFARFQSSLSRISFLEAFTSESVFNIGNHFQSWRNDDFFPDIDSMLYIHTHAHFMYLYNVHTHAQTHTHSGRYARYPTCAHFYVLLYTNSCILGQTIAGARWKERVVAVFYSYHQKGKHRKLLPAMTRIDMPHITNACRELARMLRRTAHIR